MTGLRTSVGVIQGMRVIPAPYESETVCGATAGPATSHTDVRGLSGRGVPGEARSRKVTASC